MGLLENVQTIDIQPHGQRKRKLWALALVVLIPAFGLLPEILRVTLGSNFHTVVAHRLYRAAQPSGASIEEYARQYEIRTIFNLRGPDNQEEDWFNDEVNAVRRCGMAFVSVNLSASDKPYEKELRKLVDAFDESPEPILLHCNSGSDRSGFASVCYLLLKTNTPLAEARGQLSIRYGHIAWSKAGCLEKVLDQYRDWLDKQNLKHAPEHFRRWARDGYKKDDW